MNTDQSVSAVPIAPGVGAITAGIGLLVMAVIAPLAVFGVIDPIVVAGDPVATAANVTEGITAVRLATVGLVVVLFLDVIVAWGLYGVFYAVNPGVSLLGAWFRLIYTAVFAVAIANLVGVPLAAARVAAGDAGHVLYLISAYHQTWQAALVLFGVHLGIIGGLAWRSRFVPRILAALIVVAGVGYVVDGVALLLNPAFPVQIATFAFVGEVLFIFWLLTAGRNLRAR